MKPNRITRALTALVLSLLLLMPCAALGTGVDLSAMSDSEIVDLLEQLSSEMVSRGIEKTAQLAAGKYIAGHDLPVGRYIYTCRASSGEWGNVTIYSGGTERTQKFWEVLDESDTSKTYYMNLEEGDELKSGVPFSLTIMSTVIFR